MQGIDLRDRTHHCAEMEARHEGQQVVLAGWVHRLRDHGGVVFIDLRDRHGVTQLVLRAETSPAPYREAKELRAEAVIGVHGRVVRRGTENRNPSIPTGEIEVLVDRLEVFNSSDPLPFPVEGPDRGGEELRLKYRYLDLRGSRSQAIFRLRHRVALAARRFLDAAGFVEIETPALTKSTPEGSREYLVPSRVNPGRFYSLPQSPQLFKQILMIAGFDRYFQIARCYRDEDLRADRQPEFTQIDLEMSFVKQEGIFAVVEGLMAEIFRVAGVPLSGPFPVLDYEEAMRRYGTDKPDLRFGMEILDLTPAVPASEFPPVREAIAAGGGLRGLLLEGRAGLSRREQDGIGEFCRERGVPRVFWLPFRESGGRSPLAEKIGVEAAARLLERAGARVGDGLLFVAGPTRAGEKALGALRLHLAERFGLHAQTPIRMLWVQNFPLFEREEATGQLTACHHPFTSPRPEDLARLESDPDSVRAQAYDLVLDGEEIGGGSIRIHRRDVQERVFRALGISPETAEQKFGFLLQALRFGAPPHGGIALGFDRIVALLTGAKSLREVIAFPKTSSAVCLMTGSPAAVDPGQLQELHLALRPPPRAD